MMGRVVKGSAKRESDKVKADSIKIYEHGPRAKYLKY